MPDPSAASDMAIAAAVRAVRGESDLDALMPALADVGPARVIALAPGVHPIVQSIAALRCGLTTLLAPEDIASPVLHAALVRLIGTPVGNHVLTAWAEIAPVGWGRVHAEALRDAVLRHMCAPAAAAVLIGPCDAGARLLTNASDIALVIRRWGESPHAGPTAWAKALSPAERDRLIATVRRDSFSAASCLPWLPPDVVRAADDDVPVGDALDAFAVASPTARAQHAAILQRLVARVHPECLDALTRLACATGAKTVWRRVQMLIRESPDDAWRVVVAAPWAALEGDVRAAILDLADGSDVCAAVAAARGHHDSAAMAITRETAIAFFAALVPDVWESIGRAAQQRWLQAAEAIDMPVAVRSLGLRPEILARAGLTNDLVHAARPHAPDDAALRAALFPVALRMVDPESAHVLIAAMPPPRDSGAFFCIAGGSGDPDVITPARAALRAPADLACAVALQRGADYRGRTRNGCALLITVLRGRAWDDLAPILALLDADARAALMPDREGLVAHLAQRHHRDQLRAALDRLAALPPEVAIPTTFALHRWTARRARASDAAEAIASTLQAYGDVFLSIVDALADDELLDALLPLPGSARQANALRALVRDDLITGRSLAYAMHERSWRPALLALLHAPPQHAAAVWQALAIRERRAIVDDLPVGTKECISLDVPDPVADLALAALQSGDPALRDASVTALAQRPATLRARWDDLPPEARHALRTHPAVAVVVADRDAPSMTDQGDHRRRLRRR